VKCCRCDKPATHRLAYRLAHSPGFVLRFVEGELGPQPWLVCGDHRAWATGLLDETPEREAQLRELHRLFGMFWPKHEKKETQL
jgi:hypothetical protein